MQVDQFHQKLEYLKLYLHEKIDKAAGYKFRYYSLFKVDERWNRQTNRWDPERDCTFDEWHEKYLDALYPYVKREKGNYNPQRRKLHVIIGNDKSYPIVVDYQKGNFVEHFHAHSMKEEKGCVVFCHESTNPLRLSRHGVAFKAVPIAATEIKVFRVDLPVRHACTTFAKLLLTVHPTCRVEKQNIIYE